MCDRDTVGELLSDHDALTWIPKWISFKYVRPDYNSSETVYTAQCRLILDGSES